MQNKLKLLIYIISGLGITCTCKALLGRKKFKLLMNLLRRRHLKCSFTMMLNLYLGGSYCSILIHLYIYYIYIYIYIYRYVNNLLNSNTLNQMRVAKKPVEFWNNNLLDKAQLTRSNKDQPKPERREEKSMEKGRSYLWSKVCCLIYKAWWS